MLLKQNLIFTKEECNSIISYNSKDITNWKMEDRKYHSQPINYSLETNWLFEKMKNFFEEETGIKIRKLKDTIHFHKFEKGNWFGRHNDVRERRLYAVGLLLNDEFDGGDFILYNPDKIILSRIVGNTYIFDVRILHEITPVLNGERYSLLWFLQNEHIISKIDKII